MMKPYVSESFPNGLPWLVVQQLPEIASTTPSTAALARNVGLPSSSSWKQLMLGGPEEIESILCTHAMAKAALPSFAQVLAQSNPNSSAQVHEITKAVVPDVLEAMDGIQPDIRAAFEAQLDSLVDAPGVSAFVAIDRRAIGAFVVQRDVVIHGGAIEYRVNPLLLGGRGNFTNVSLMLALHHQVLADMECIVNGCWLANMPVRINETVLARPGNDKNPILLITKEILVDRLKQLFGIHGERMPIDSPRGIVTIEEPRIVASIIPADTAERVLQ